MRKRFPKAFANDTSPAPRRPAGGLFWRATLLRFAGLLGGSGGRLLLCLAFFRGLLLDHLDQLDRAAGLLDFFPRRRGHLVRPHGDRLGDVAVAEDLEPVLVPLDHARFFEGVRADGSGRLEAFQESHVDHRILDPEMVREAAFRHAALDGHLPTFEPDEVHVAGARFLPLAAPSGGLPEPARLPAADPLLFLHPSTCRRSQLAELVHRVLLTRGSLGTSLARLRLRCLHSVAAIQDTVFGVEGGALPLASRWLFARARRPNFWNCSCVSSTWRR